MRHPIAALLAVGALGLVGCGSPSPASDPTTAVATPDAAAAPQVPGLVVHESRYDVAETTARVRDALAEAGTVVAVVDHAANARAIGQQLRPTTLVIGGAPPAGTPVMQAGQRAGVDLPQKFLAWQAADGTVYLGHNSVEYLAARAGIAAGSPALEALRTGSARIAAEASGTAEPVSAGDGVSGTGPEGYLVERTADTSVAEAIDRYRATFAERDLLAVGTVDHAAAAAGIGEQLRPTQVTYAGNPTAGTPLLQASQTVGIDLPARFGAWEDEAGVVRVAHPDIRVLAERHGVDGAEDTLAMIEAATAAFTATAAGSGD